MKRHATTKRPPVHILSVFFALAIYVQVGPILSALSRGVRALVVPLVNGFIHFSLPEAYGLRPLGWPEVYPYLLVQLPLNLATLAVVLVLAGYYCRTRT